MEINEILALEDFDKVRQELTKNKPEGDIEKFINEYEGEHEINNRPDKIVQGKLVKTAKIIIRFQKKIVATSIAFTIGKGKIILNTDEEEENEGLEIVKDHWKKMKLNRHTRNLLFKLYVETRVAELFYLIKKQVNGKTELLPRVRILCKSNGDNIYPYFDEYGDMTAFTREYKTQVNGKDVDAIDVYTADKVIHAYKDSGVWVKQETVNYIKKIPVVYYEQKAPEWSDVQELIDRIEYLLSSHADTNDYVGNPAIKIKGEILKMPDKQENVKVFQLKPTTINGTQVFGDVDYMAYSGAPESIRMEYTNLKELIYSLTYTPDLSFNNIKGVGALHGIAFRFMFLDSMLKAETKREELTEGLERRVNILKAIIANVVDIKSSSKIGDLDINFTYQDITPDNLIETIDSLTKATAGQPILSRKTAVGLNPLVTSPENEYKQKIEEPITNKIN